ncbi:S8 family peptidase [Clostridium cellulovorans]|uniref:Peptidase S8 and S53 subtilisin kexin sedolisin n=1 Tax=Clostridium cellulovorans (strain ATCC 35296 / DSM 3052 / OCM 3 / 743B) TaxID=573061 RepID=D9SUS4_CLOC7|nr:S8 family peptidase [Clostridium cellulovorans]ADL50979.1 peptidase S8 and S53 subtilisin kexin sedolisin [Clostridium cellulovorans 743B]
MKKNNAFPEDILKNVNFFPYLVQYEGDIENTISSESGYYTTIINDMYAILEVPKEQIEPDIKNPFLSSIVYVKPTEMYTLQEISPLETYKSEISQLDLPLPLTGKGVTIAIIDTGIDYLSKEFMTATGETRIEAIWDQTIISSKEYQANVVPIGTVYSKEEINRALLAHSQGKDPYEIVPSKDEIGHGTKMAGIIGATGDNPALKGFAYECNYIIIKLLKDYAFEDRFHTEVPVFNTTHIIAALQFLYEYTLVNNNPLVVYFPLGTNFGNHKGYSLLDQFIDFISMSGRIVFVCGTGNQCGKGLHTSGIISEAGETGIIEIDVSPKQQDLWLEIWTALPNIMSLSITSPSGDNTDIIPVRLSKVMQYNYVFESTLIKIVYYLPEENTGDELIRIRLYNIQPGIWSIMLKANDILDGRYDAWLAQEGITVGGTKFTLGDDFGTITAPGGSTYTVTVAAYNQNNNTILQYSGRAFLSTYTDIIDIAAGGVNALTVAPNNETAIVNGTSVAAAIVAGVCALLFEWAIINGNDPYIHAQTIRTYLSRGTTKRKGDIYPNPQWGYGILDILQLFKYII